MLSLPVPSFLPATKRKGPALQFALYGYPGSTLRRVPPACVEAIQARWVDRMPMILGPDALGPLASWERQLHGLEPPSIPGWEPEGPGRQPVDAQPLINRLRELAAASTPFTLNALYREKQGGREYPYLLAGYDGPVTVSQRRYDAAKKCGPRLLLSAMRRDVRALLRLPEGWTLLVADYKTCHGHIGVALTGDANLAHDLAGDWHQIMGDAVLPAGVPDAVQRRNFGKAINNAMLFGMEPSGLAKLYRKHYHSASPESWPADMHAAWWARYSQFAVFRDQVKALVRHAQAEGCGLHIVAPSGRVSKFDAWEVQGRVARGWREARGPDGVWRTVLSAVFRAVEGDLLDRTLLHGHIGREAHGGRLVLPLYDGLLVAAPLGGEAAVAAALEAAGAHAAAELGIPSMRLVVG